MPFSGLVTSEKGKRAFRFMEAYAVAFALALGGAVAGYSYSEYRLRVIVLNLATEHQAEVKRLQDTNMHILSALTSQVQTAAQKVDQAGAKVASAADQSASAAQSAASAVAVIRRTRPRVIVEPEPVPEPVRANLNNAIERTNRKLLEQRK